MSIIDKIKTKNIFSDHTKIIQLLEALDIIYTNHPKLERLDNLTDKLDNLELPVYIHVSSPLKNKLEHPNVRFVNSGNYDFQSVHIIISQMGIEELPKESQQWINRAIKQITDIYCDYSIVNNSLVNVANDETITAYQLKNILLGLSQLYIKRTHINEIGIRRAQDEEDLTITLLIYDLSQRATNDILKYRRDLLIGKEGDPTQLVESIKVLSRSLSLAPKVLFGFCFMVKRYIQKLTYEAMNQFPEAIDLIFKAFNSEIDLEQEQLFEFACSSGLLSSHLKKGIKQKEVQIFNMIMETFRDNDILGENSTSKKMLSTLEVSNVSGSIADSLIGDTINKLKGVVDKSFIKRYGNNLTLEIDPADVFKLSHSNKVGLIVKIESSDCTPVYVVANHLNLDIIAKDIETGDIVLISIIRNGENISSLDIFKNLKTKGDETLRCTRLKFKQDESVLYNLEVTDVTTEGLKISEDGGIKITYKPKLSFMDEYAKAHKIIHANYKAGNYEALKTDLAFLFAFINYLESRVIYSRKPVSTSKKEDAIKARMFAINDFKFYLKKLQEHEPNFDFTKFYENIDTSKVILQFSDSEIKGIRKLLRTILYG